MNRLKKYMQPILKQKCSEAYQKGVEDGWRKKSKAYENDIEFLRGIIEKKKYLAKENGDIIPLDMMWISVKDRLPEEYETVLVYSGGVEPAWRSGDMFYEYDKYEGWAIDNVTHWMPLPEPPKGE